ncbi:hypothetical protein HDV06_002052 [Boothiomyces sp. JEL0866]|nr:hypothetical protein HDV06_002052 [Boothiomyces sp. JEL0866]
MQQYQQYYQQYQQYYSRSYGVVQSNPVMYQQYPNYSGTQYQLAGFEQQRQKQHPAKPAVLDQNNQQGSQGWPDSLKNYLSRAINSSTPATKTMIEIKLKKVIGVAMDTNSVWTTDWERMPLPDPFTSQDHIPSVPPRLAPAYLPAAISKKQNMPSPLDSTPNVGSPSMNSPLGSKKASKLLSKSKGKSSISSPSVGKAIFDSDSDDKDSDMSHLTPVEREIETKRREHRRNRFKADKDEHLSKERKKKQQSERFERERQEYGDDHQDFVNWDGVSIIGTCQDLEKPYLRLTSAPDPSTVRPLSVLTRTLEYLKQKWKKEENYTYICDQFKSLRQDLTVQQIKNEFTVKVYETHARIAIEKGDLGEYNQCSAQLNQLYNIFNQPGCKDEFVSYRIIYMLHTFNRKDLIKLLGSIANPGPNVKHALSVRSSLSMGDYNTFFKLYHSAPNMSGYLMDQFIERERLNLFKKLTKAFRPKLSISQLCLFLGIALSDPKKKEIRETKEFVQKYGILIEEEQVDCKMAYGILVEQVQLMERKGVDIKGQIH